MVYRRGMKNTDTDTPTPAARIAEYQHQLNHLARRRPAHLLALAMSALKYLILESESDSTRLAAIRTVLDLPPVQAKLSQLAATQSTRKPAAALSALSDEKLALLEKLLEEEGVAKVN